MTRYLVFSLAATGMFAQTPSRPATKSTVRPAVRPAVKSTTPAPPPIPLPAEDGQYAILNTTMGRIVIKLFEKETPITVANFVGLARGTKSFVDEKTHVTARRPFYNGLIFHRVIPKFMIQGGDPVGTGSGGGGVKSIQDEFVPEIKFDQPGRLAMANVGRPNTGGCQFFITTTGSEAGYLNGKHTIFGQVVEGQDVVDAISGVERSPDDRPNTPVVIKTLLIRRVGKDPAAPVPVPVKKPVPATQKKAA